jgi:hypothetical protein
MPTKTRKRHFTKKAAKPSLEDFTSQELFTELMTRILIKRPDVCYFIDSNCGVWNIHAACSESIVETKKLGGDL